MQYKDAKKDHNQQGTNKPYPGQKSSHDTNQGGHGKEPNKEREKNREKSY